MSFKCRDGTNESRKLEIVVLSQNRLNTVRNHKICCMFQKIGSRVLEITPKGSPSETKLWVLGSPNQSTSGSKISLLV